MPDVFSHTFQVSWSELDANAHMKNTAYMDKALDVRMLYFKQCGFPMAEFERLRLGPVVRRDEIEYFRELRLLEVLQVTLLLAGLSADGSRFRLRNELYRAEGQLAAKITSTGGWLDLTARKLTRPPEGLLAALRGLVQSADYEELPSSLG